MFQFLLMHIPEIADNLQTSMVQLKGFPPVKQLAIIHWAHFGNQLVNIMAVGSSNIFREHCPWA